MPIDVFNASMTAGQYTFLGILQGANNATNQLFSSILVLSLYFLLFVVFKTRLTDMRSATLAMATVMLFLCLFMFWIDFINQYVITTAIVVFVGSLIMAIWRGDQ
jgi:hypothetical protein